jgi:hypothetical protein
MLKDIREFESHTLRHFCSAARANACERSETTGLQGKTAREIVANCHLTPLMFVCTSTLDAAGVVQTFLRQACEHILERVAQVLNK